MNLINHIELIRLTAQRILLDPSNIAIVTDSARTIRDDCALMIALIEQAGAEDNLKIELEQELTKEANLELSQG